MKRWLLILAVMLSPVQARAITAKSWLVASSNNEIIASENQDSVRSIASITKLLLAMTVMDAHQDYSQMLPLSYTIKDRLPTRGTSLSRRQLLELALVNSDNRAAQTLCENYPGGFDACVSAMNKKLQDLGMKNSVVHEPTGLDERNVSTAVDLMRLVKAALTYPIILEDSRKTKVEIKVKKKFFIFPQTNRLVGHTQEILVTKTGYTRPAGGCIVMVMKTDLGERIVIVLGSKNTHTRIPEAEIISKLPSH